MKTCPECGHVVKDTHEKCMKCGAAVPETPAAEAPAEAAPRSPGARARERLAPLRELVPTRKAVDELLPHPTGWILGIAIPAILLLMVIHGFAFPEKASAKDDGKAKATGKAEATRFQRCLAQARAKADLECGSITGTASGMRRMTCTAARLSADYTTCTARLTGRVGQCLGRCGQAARSCSSACALTGAPDQDWTDTAKCLLPCWAERLTSCTAACFRTGGEEPAPRSAGSSI